MAWHVFERLRTVGIMEIGFDGRILRCNRALAKLIGCDQTELVGRPKVDFIAPEDRLKAYERMRAYTLGQVDQCDTESRLIKPNGARIWVSLESVVLLNAKGERDSILCMVYEIPNGEQASKVMELERKLTAVSELVMQLASAKASPHGVTLNIGQTNVDDVSGGRNVIGENNEQRHA